MSQFFQKHFPWRLLSRLVTVQTFLVLAALLAAGFSARYLFGKAYREQVEEQLFDTLRTLSQNVPEKIDTAWCKKMVAETGLRFTAVAFDGKVLCDSHHEAATMDNHRLRPEILEAEKNIKGVSLRSSTTLNQEMLYAALALPERQIFLRSAIPLIILKNAMRNFDSIFAVIFTIVFALLLTVSYWSSRHFIEPLKAVLLKTENLLNQSSVQSHSDSKDSSSFGEWQDLEKSLDQINLANIKRAEQMRIDFVANVSHELRTPLTAIKGYIDTVKFDMATGRPVEKHYIEIIEKNTERLILLIQDLLDLSSLDRGAAFEMSTVDVREITQRAVQQLSRQIDTKGQSVTVEYEVLSLVADSKRLEQVLVNLLDNASKYTGLGGRIEILWLADGNQGAVLKVRDSGPGISPEHHPRLFERFYRVDRSRSREEGGTGLGLSIVKHIMQGHRGDVSVESVVGKGSTFTCRFPLNIEGELSDPQQYDAQKKSESADLKS